MRLLRLVCFTILAMAAQMSAQSATVIVVPSGIAVAGRDVARLHDQFILAGIDGDHFQTLAHDVDAYMWKILKDNRMDKHYRLDVEAGARMVEGNSLRTGRIGKYVIVGYNAKGVAEIYQVTTGFNRPQRKMFSQIDYLGAASPSGRVETFGNANAPFVPFRWTLRQAEKAAGNSLPEKAKTITQRRPV